MKKIILALITLISTSANAGEIISKSGSFIRFEFDEKLKTVLIDVREGSESYSKNIAVKQFENLNQNGIHKVRTDSDLYMSGGDENLQDLFRKSSEVNTTFKEMFNHAWVGYLIPGLNVLYLAVNAWDVVELPINITRKTLRNKWARNDLKVIQRALNTNEKQEISDKQFRRLFFYF